MSTKLYNERGREIWTDTQRLILFFFSLFINSELSHHSALNGWIFHQAVNGFFFLNSATQIFMAATEWSHYKHNLV